MGHMDFHPGYTEQSSFFCAVYGELLWLVCKFIVNDFQMNHVGPLTNNTASLG